MGSRFKVCLKPNVNILPMVFFLHLNQVCGVNLVCVVYQMIHYVVSLMMTAYLWLQGVLNIARNNPD